MNNFDSDEADEKLGIYKTESGNYQQKFKMKRKLWLFCNHKKIKKLLM
jgi:hypothetical protein